jgi:hypothetical protein
MKKMIFVYCIIAGVIFGIIIGNIVLGQNSLGLAFIPMAINKENQYFNKSYSQISSSMIASWDSTFRELGIDDDPFWMTIYFIKFFQDFEKKDTKRYFSLREILSKRHSNIKSNVIAISAIMQKLDWDVIFFYNKKEYYIGLNFTENWRIRKGNWVEKDGKTYYLKEFDDFTPAGELKRDDPASTYRTLKYKRPKLKPLPPVVDLPAFSDVTYKKRLKWYYDNKEYAITIYIPKEQIEWTRNLPPSLYGMIASGMEELKNVDLTDKLKFLLSEFDEYDKVNFLLKFCQSESIFVYDGKQSIKSVSIQLLEGKNDCDGRSVFLYCLLRTVVDYDDSDIVFVSWPNHLSLGLRPKTKKAEKILRKDGFYAGDKYYVLDAAYTGDTHWGSKMERLPNECEVIR